MKEPLREIKIEAPASEAGRFFNLPFLLGAVFAVVFLITANVPFRASWVDGGTLGSVSHAIDEHPALATLTGIVFIGVASPFSMLSYCILGLLLWRSFTRRRIALEILAGTSIVVIALYKLLPPFYSRSGPHALSNTFPCMAVASALSLHVLLNYEAFLLRIPRQARIGTIAISIAACIILMAGQLVLGLAWPIDVIAGVALGLAIGFWGMATAQRLLTFSDTNVDAETRT